MTATDANDRTDLQGQAALVTGAGRGIGRSIALALASAGANVALAARSEDELVSVAAEIEAIGPRALAISTDVSDLDALEHLFDTIDREFGRLDIQVNNAGVGLRTPLLEVTPEEWDRVHNINLRSLFFACQHGLRRMVGARYGRIINTASLTSFLGFKHISVYGASKGGVAQLTRAIAIEFAEHGITSNAIAPGYILTELTRPRHEDPEINAWIMSRIPLGRWGQPDDIGGVVAFLASPAAEYISGVILPVDGAWLAA